MKILGLVLFWVVCHSCVLLHVFHKFGSLVRKLVLGLF